MVPYGMDLQALLAERAALALSLGVTVAEVDRHATEVCSLEDLLLEVQVLREVSEEQRRRSAACGQPSDARVIAANPSLGVIMVGMYKIDPVFGAIGFILWGIESRICGLLAGKDRPPGPG